MLPSWPAKKPFIRGIPVGPESTTVPGRYGAQTDGEANYRDRAIEESGVAGTEKNATDVKQCCSSLTVNSDP